MRKKIIKTLIGLTSLCFFASLSLCSCKDNANKPSPDDDNVPPGVVYDLEVNKTELSLQVGDKFQLNAQTEAGLTIEYTSTNEAVATVDATGNITAVGLGTAEIVVSVGEFTQARVAVAVEQVVVYHYSVELGVNDVNLRVGERFGIDANVYYQGERVEGAMLTYASEIEAIATVDASGTIEAVNTGSTDIVVSYVVDGEPKASSVVSVTVIGEYAMTAKLDNEKGYFLPGETLKADILSIVNGDGETVNYDTNDITWISSDTSIVEVVNGSITAVKNGTAYVTVAYKYGAAATFEIKVAKTIYRPSEFIDAINNGGVYVLFDDLDMSGYTLSAFTKFDGILDGNYHEVKNINRQAGTWQGNSVGEAALIKELTEGSVVKNIAFTNYTIRGMATQSGFVQTNNGTLENVVVTITRDVTKPCGWEQLGSGLLCGSVLTWINNGSIKNCVAYNLSGSNENYAIATAVNNGVIDGVYGFIEADDVDGDDSNNAINVWNSWRGAYDINMVWQEPTNYGDFDSVSTNVGAKSSKPATNSVALNGFGDTRLAGADFNDEFMTLVKSTFIEYEIPTIDVFLAKEKPVNLDELICPTTTNSFGLTFEYELANGTLATIEDNIITGVISGKTYLYVHLKDGNTVLHSTKMPCTIQQYIVTYTGGNAIDVNKNTSDAMINLNVKDGLSIRDSALSNFDYAFSSTNNKVATVDANTGVITPIAGGKTDIYVTLGNENYYVTTLTVRSWTAVSTPAGFMAINNVTGGYYYLTTDLDMTGYVWKGVAEFTGIIDGNYHAVKNLAKQPGNWGGNAPGTAAFITNLATGSELKNIAFVDYMIFAIYDGDGVTPLGMATQSGFVQTNNGVIENVVLTMTRNVGKTPGWEQPGAGLICGSVLTWRNNGSIKNCVVYNLSGAKENYAIAAAINNGTIDGVYGFIEADEGDGDSSNNPINTWNEWRGLYKIGMVWQQPNVGDFASISATIGVTNSNAATNSVALNGFDDPALTAALASFDEGFVAMVTKYYKAQ